MNFTFRRLIAGAALLGALLLLYFEIAKFRGAESWFWIAVAGLAAILSMIELMSGARPGL